jgi:hypothetical protein
MEIFICTLFDFGRAIKIHLFFVGYVIQYLLIALSKRSFISDHLNFFCSLVNPQMLHTNLFIAIISLCVYNINPKNSDFHPIGKPMGFRHEFITVLIGVTDQIMLSPAQVTYNPNEIAVLSIKTLFLLITIFIIMVQISSTDINRGMSLSKPASIIAAEAITSIMISQL